MVLFSLFIVMIRSPHISSSQVTITSYVTILIHYPFFRHLIMHCHSLSPHPSSFTILTLTISISAQLHYPHSHYHRLRSLSVEIGRRLCGGHNTGCEKKNTFGLATLTALCVCISFLFFLLFLFVFVSCFFSVYVCLFLVFSCFI